MQKFIIPLSESMPGMLVAETLSIINNELIYIEANQKLSADLINRLAEENLEEICIFINSWDDVWKISKETKDHYIKCTEIVKCLFNKITHESSIDFAAFSKLKDEVNRAFQDNYKAIGCINLLNRADSYTYTHSINVALLAALIGKWMKYERYTIDALMIAGLMHDIGKMKIDKNIINKPAKLTEAEFDEIKNHTIYSYELIQKNREIDFKIKMGILMHHERMDGSGYPYGVYNEDIGDIAKILAIADSYDAMISEKPYQKKRSPFEVMQLLQEGVFGKLDMKILKVFLSNIATYYIGTYVLLNTGDIGEVVAINPLCVYRPIVRIKERYIDMYHDRSMQIVNLV